MTEQIPGAITTSENESNKIENGRGSQSSQKVISANMPLGVGHSGQMYLSTRPLYPERTQNQS